MLAVVFVGDGMEKIYLIFLFMPFALGSAVFWVGKILNKPSSSFGLSAGLLWMLVTLGFFGHFYFEGKNFLVINWEILSVTGFSLGMKINLLNLLFSVVNSILLLLAIIFISGQEGSNKAASICIGFFMTGLVTCALMAKSLYTFFILSEIIFLIHYFYGCQILSKGKIILTRTVNSIAAMILFFIVLYVGEKGYGFMTFFNVLTPELELDKKLIFLGLTLYFIIKLFFFPLHGKSSNVDNPLSVINNFFVEHIALILFVYGLKQYVVDTFPLEFKNYVSTATFVFAIGSSFFCIASLMEKNLLGKKFWIKKSLICLILGAFLSFDQEVYMGIFTLLICHIFGMIALYAFFNGKKTNGVTGYSKKEMLVLAAILYSLSFLPLSGNFVGFCKILLGYKSIHLYSLFFIVIGLFFLFMNLAKEFFKLSEEKMFAENLLHKNATVVVTACLAIIFLIGFNPMIIEHFM